MTGLEKIIQVIEADAKANVEKILAEAKAEADSIIASAKKEAEQKCAEIAEKPVYEVNAVLDRARSGAMLVKRQMILNAKQKVINDVIEKAKNKLTSLPDTDYFNVILQIVKKHAHPQAGVIMFSESDLKRLPKDFDKSLENAISDVKGASLIISKECAQIDSGCLLVYGDIEENCSFDALFNVEKEVLQDKVNAFLFG